MQLHLHAPLQALDDADDIAVFALRRHEIGEADGAFRRLERRFQDQRLPPIRLRGLGRRRFGADLPVAVFCRAQQRCEAGVGIEARRAQPIDGAVHSHQGAAVGVADKSVVFQFHAGKGRTAARGKRAAPKRNLRRPKARPIVFEIRRPVGGGP